MEEVTMTATVKAKIRNSPIMPVREFTAVKDFEFEETDNVFYRLAVVRKYFYETFRISNFMDLEIKEVVWRNDR